jgi:cysteine protease ATG4
MLDIRELTRVEELDPVQEHYVTAYSPQELRTFHCERVRKMPLSGLDPSMLIGFLCRDEADWKDLRTRLTEITKTHKAIFAIQDEPPHWPSDNDSYMGFESFSEPDVEDDILSEGRDEDDAQSDDGSNDEFFDASASRREPSRSPSRSMEDTDDSSGADPITPGGGRFDPPQSAGAHTSEEGDIEDDWVETNVSPEPSPAAETAPLPLDQSRIAVSPSASSFVPVSMSESATTVRNTPDKGARRKGKGKHTQEQSYPFPVSSSQDSSLDELDPEEQSHTRERSESRVRRVPQMRTAVARDGGRTKSGGVRGIPTDST